MCGTFNSQRIHSEVSGWSFGLPSTVSVSASTAPPSANSVVFMNSFLPRLLRLTTVLLAYTVVFVARSSAQSRPYLLEPTTPSPSMRLTWQTEPGVRYDLWQSTDLFSWSQVLGYPATAAGLSEEYVFNLGPRGFFRIVPIDEQPPIVTEQYPADSGFAVGKFADLAVRLADPSGIDPASIRLTVGSVGPLAVGAPGLAFSRHPHLRLRRFTTWRVG